MRVWTALRIMPAFWLGVPLSILAFWYATLVRPTFGYGVAATALGTSVLALVVPAVAAVSSWEGSRLRRGGVWAFPMVRMRLAVAALAIAPGIVVGTIAVLVAVSEQVSLAQATGIDLRMVAVALFDLIAWASLGFAAGLKLPTAIAVPAATLVPFLWLAFVPAFEPVWLRHVTGMFRDCCAASQDLAPRAVLASAIVDVGLLLCAATLILTARPRARRVAVAALVPAIAIATGLAIVAGMAYSPAIPRDPRGLVCGHVETGSTICVWPEHAAKLGDYSIAAASVLANWRTSGESAPTVVTEVDRSIVPQGGLSVVLPDDAQSDKVVLSLARGLVPTLPECPYGTTAGGAYYALEAWRAVSGGLSKAAYDREYGGVDDLPNPPLRALIRTLESASLDQRDAWIVRMEALIGSCTLGDLDLTPSP